MQGAGTIVVCQILRFVGQSVDAIAKNFHSEEKDNQ